VLTLGELIDKLGRHRRGTSKPATALDRSLFVGRTLNFALW
jgi:hypothetical protein